MQLSGVLLPGLLSLWTAVTCASPLSGDSLNDRSLPASECAKVTKVISILKVQSATPFCSSFLGIKTSTSIITTVRTSTVTSTTGTPSTTVVFLPGNPPASKERREAAAVAGAPLEKRDNPAYLSGIASSAISSGCECLNLPTPVTKTTTTSTKKVTTKGPASTVTKTVYPCATPIPSLTPNVPYGLSSGSPNIVGGVGNSLYGSGTSGTTLEGCCNLCYFEVPNCVQAYWYFYQGCVINAVTVNSTGPGISNICPNGQIPGLTYSPDSNPPFRSTGDIAGPCGQTYNNLG